jgi:cysteinyl-tRNA synthetase
MSLINKKLDQNIIGAGHGDEADSGKKKPYDFSVWFFKTGVHANALQTWKHKFNGIDQQIEEGFPGWHIECSAMAKSTLDDQIDVHFGGVEHIPIHHTNEIAQSEAANGKKFTNYWLHHELLMVDGTKMSKSLGNVYSLDDLIERGFSPMDYRYFLLQAHYRSKQNFTWEALQASKVGRERLVEQLRGIKKEAGDRRQESGEQSEHRTLNTEHFNKFKEALEADFNIPAALAVVWEVLKSELSPEEKLELVLDFDRVLGLDLENELKQEAGVGSQEPVSPEIQELIEKRNQFRAEKKYQEADEIRDRLMNEFGVEVKDK